MPTIDLLPAGSRGRWRAAVIAAIIVGIPAWLGACGLMQEWPPPETAGINARMVEPSPGATAPGPIVLAPSITGAPASPPAPPSPPATPVAAAPTPPLSRPLPPPAMPVAVPPAPPEPAIPVAARAPAPAAPVDIPTFAPASCPPGAIAMLSEPDAAGVPALICRRVGRPR